jgi:hypothetical protein
VKSQLLPTMEISGHSKQQFLQESEVKFGTASINNQNKIL